MTHQTFFHSAFLSVHTAAGVRLRKHLKQFAFIHHQSIDKEAKEQKLNHQYSGICHHAL